MRNFALLIFLLLSATASADPLSVTKSEDSDGHRFAISVNSPYSWVAFQNVAASAYIGLNEHQAVRINVASYAYDANLVAQGAVALTGGDNVDGPFRDAVRGVHRGRLLDVGAGWMYFPHRTYDGPMFELGLMHRSGSTHLFMSGEGNDRDTQLYAARALAGWSLLIHDRVMVSLAVGAAGGYERGVETTMSESLGKEYVDTHHVSQWSTSVEGYFRVGFTFGN